MIVIHIGLRKAGSTSIQGFLAANREALLKLGVDYPRVGGAKPQSNHVNIAAEIRGRKNFDPKAGTLGEIAARRRASDAPTLVLSAEALEECSADEAARLAILAKDGEEVRIVLILRDLVDLVPSSYAQMVKTGRKTHDFDLFFIRRLRERRMDYADTAARWAEFFGWRALRVRLLDRVHLLNGDLIDDFLAILGVDPASEEARGLKRPARANVTPGWRVVEAIRALYAGRPGLEPEHPLAGVGLFDAEERRVLGVRALEVGDEMDWNADRGRYLTRTQAQECLDHYRAGVAGLNARLGGALPEPVDLKARGFQPREIMPDFDLIERALARTFYDALGARVAARLRPGEDAASD